MRQALRVVAFMVVCAPTFAQQMQVEGRTVETQADGPCLNLLTTGTQRYVNCGNGTVYDAQTGLLWLRDASCGELGTNGLDDWHGALLDVADLQQGLCNLSDHSQPGDWRLPTSAEWERTVEYARDSLVCVAAGAGGAPSLTDDTGLACYGTGTNSSFVGVLELYWSANAVDAVPFQNENRSLSSGGTSNIAKSFSNTAVWPVRRGGSPGVTGAVVVEGATVETRADGPCYESAATGEERYVDCGDGTVLDLFTGLLWLADANCLDLAGVDGEGKANWPTAMAAVAALAAPTCGLTDGSQPGDWRLATTAEWLTTMQRAKALNCTTAGGPDPPTLTDDTGVKCLANGTTSFTGVFPFSYWTSEITNSGNLSVATVATLSTGNADDAFKVGFFWVWPVRERK